MQHGGKTDLVIEKKLADFGRIISLSNAENRAKICQATAEIIWCILCEYKHRGARLTTLPSANVNIIIMPVFYIHSRR